ncbi:hypothetical protein JCM10296v2_003255 [Rhodotorula toruloides]
MTTSLPHEVALPVIDFGQYRRLDESAIEHMRRLTRIGSTCKAFYRVVERTLRTTMFAKLSTNLHQSFIDRTLAAKRAGKPFETLYLRIEDDVMASFNIAQMHGREALRKVVLPGESRPGVLYPRMLRSEYWPALACLVASGSSIRGQATHPYLALRELAVDLDAPHWAQQLVSPSITPNLRVLAVRDCGPLAPRAYDLFDNDLLARLDFIQLTFRPFHFDSTSRIFSQHSTPVLVCPDRAAAGGIIPNNFRPPYLQLHSIHGSIEQSAIAVRHLAACIRQGAAKQALFLPQELHPSTAIPASSLLSRARGELLDAIEDAEVEYVGWYHADEETDASISGPFRRYLDRERLDGRM